MGVKDLNGCKKKTPLNGCKRPAVLSEKVFHRCERPVVLSEKLCMGVRDPRCDPKSSIS